MYLTHHFPLAHCSQFISKDFFSLVYLPFSSLTLKKPKPFILQINLQVLKSLHTFSGLLSSRK
jgi:hypothetical protein